jgi:hypothetical protein
LLRCEDWLVHSAGLYALADELDGIAERYGREDFHWLGKDCATDNVVGLEFRSCHMTPQHTKTDISRQALIVQRAASL